MGCRRKPLERARAKAPEDSGSPPGRPRKAVATIARAPFKQIARRLSILDQEYGFIRTQIFWVRDQDPLAFGTFWQGAREVNILLKAVLRLAQETTKPNLWGRPSAEFMAMSLAVLLLPVPVMKLRRTLGGMIES